MKNKTGMITGFIAGTAGFLLLFKIFVLPKIAPSDEIAPGLVVIASVGIGVMMGFVGYLVQGRVVKG